MTARPARRLGILVLPLVTLAVTAGVAYQAIAAVRAHRATAEGVLRDYANFAAEQYVARVTREISLYGMYPAMTWLLGQDPGARAALGGLDSLTAGASRVLRQSFELQAALFHLDVATGALAITADSPIPPEVILSRVRALDRGAFQEDWPFALAWPGPLAYAWTGTAAAPVVYGTVIDSLALLSYFRAAFSRGSLLPTTLIGEAPPDSVVWASILTVAGDEMLALAPPHSDPEASPRATRSLGPQFGGLQVRLGIQSHTVGTLVIGGMPGSRMALTIALVVLAAGLLAITILQLHRERQLARLRSEFVSNVSHELRTPLAQIRMFAETLLLGRVRTTDEETRALRIIDRESRRLTSLVENVLHISRSERHVATVAPAPTDLAKLVAEVVEAFRPLADAAGVTIALQTEPVSAVVDAGAVRQIVLNLLDNAVKYGPPEQTVIVALTRNGRDAMLAVTDQGPGIPASQRDLIWHRFHRLDDPQGRATAGAGIGLAVVRELALLHGGRAHVEAAVVGSRFLVTLPLAGPTDGDRDPPRPLT